MKSIFIQLSLYFRRKGFRARYALGFLLSIIVFGFVFFPSLILLSDSPAFALEIPEDLGREVIQNIENYWDGVKNRPEKLLPYVVAIVFLSVLIKTLFNFLGRWRLAGTGYGGKGYIKQMYKDARKFEKQREYIQAGDIYEQINALDKAKEMYKRGKGNHQVGRICERLQQFDQAAAFYEAGQSYENAAKIYQKGKKYQKAAELYLKANKMLLAGEMYETGKFYLEAGRIYEKASFFDKAGWMYLSARERFKAAEMFERFYLQEHHKANDARSPISSERSNGLKSYAKKSGELYQASGKKIEAGNIFALGGFIEEAALAFQEAGEFQRAADLYLSVKDFQKAAEVLKQGGDFQQGDLFIGEKYAREERYSEAAFHFERAQDFNQAGDMYERAGTLDRAAEMYLKGGDYLKASELFVAVGDKKRAAQSLEMGKKLYEAANMYREIGDLEKAVSLLEIQSEFLEAALLKKEQGKIEESILLLQKVDSTSEDYSEATLALARLFMDKGMYGPAREKYQRALLRRPVTQETIEHYYFLASLHEKLEDHENALILYERILAEDIQFKDVKNRLEVLKRRMAEASPKRKGKDAPSQVVENRYRLIKEIGRGGMGLVYRAEDMVLKRIVAYKILPDSVRGNPMVLNSFLQEARTAASMHHPNIVTIFDTGQSGGEYYITMEYVDGMNLKDLLDKTQLLPIGDVLFIFQQICTGMDYAHSRRVIHRDIKPGNVMVSREKIVKIMDFGLAKIVHDSKSETTEVKGTPLYMSPEQILGKEVDHQSDIYSLGCTVYRMVTGKPPFSGGDVFYQHLHTAPRAPVTLNSKIPPALNRVILKCLEKDKQKRYSRVKDIIEDLSSGQ